MTVLDIADKLTDDIIRELDGRSVFNGIDDDIMEEIREALFDIIAKEVT